MPTFDDQIQRGWDHADRDDPQPTIEYFAALHAQHGTVRSRYHYARSLDYAGRPAEAVPLYEQVLGGGGLAGDELRRCTVSYCSSLRNLGRYPHALSVALGADQSWPQDPLVTCYLALCLHSAGRGGTAIAELLDLAVTQVPALNRWDHHSLNNYAQVLRDHEAPA